MKSNITWPDFEKIDLRCGTITKAEAFPEAREPAYKLWIDFGAEIGIRKSSAQITEHYSLEELVGQQVMAVINFPPKQIGHFLSECLVCGFYTNSGVVLVQPSRNIENGSILG